MALPAATPYASASRRMRWRYAAVIRAGAVGHFAKTYAMWGHLLRSEPPINSTYGSHLKYQLMPTERLSHTAMRSPAVANESDGSEGLTKRRLARGVNALRASTAS